MELPEFAKWRLAAVDRRLDRWCATSSPYGMIRVILRRRKIRDGILRKYRPYSPGLQGLFGVDQVL
jgi:hypothetical protein